uniref:Uncharacterized protein n=1 Tax=Anguilla anguilla TaxID=7936 RepID=A0A0E9W2R4_ANGAN
MPTADHSCPPVCVRGVRLFYSVCRLYVCVYLKCYVHLCGVSWTRCVYV